MFNRLWMTGALMLAMTANANEVEEARLESARAQLPDVVDRYQGFNDKLSQTMTAATDDLELTRLVADQGKRLWQQAVTDVRSGNPDDRPLYWSRLNMRDTLASQDAGIKLVDWQRLVLLNAVEKASRGMSDIQFDDDVQLRILLTGFDPFFLDRDISQSNPSGLVALSLDGYRFTVNGKTAQIETAMIPVRFTDFDQGLIESLLTPVYRDKQADMIVTVSMGRDQFDLERFVARNRSARAPDNRNLYTGADKSHPLAPLFQGKTLNGPEFIEFSLPAGAMTGVAGKWPVRDNHNVNSLERGEFAAQSIGELTNLTSVEGGGGGYLSNEISYRALRLQVLMDSDIPTGHIHTPRVKSYDRETEMAIVEQTRDLVAAAAATL
ncbi:hypothetical protein L2750_01365 [Shewanella submarina]|uniref:Pyrrolidone-carboxylate peptidase n=1 Tax=Shewanella submarina TaxID=2016376 RepID=A0ABV7GIN5_9GAMM|nr:hypothetical protein [Shewanella submarina]MCL1035807.1 hypothetical protein [Shewanella submarina]